MKRLVAISMLVGMHQPAFAQVTTMESANAATKDVAGDPNRIICERVERTGSRLAVEKVCMTSRQWKDHRQGQREDVERVQRTENQEPTH